MNTLYRNKLIVKYKKKYNLIVTLDNIGDFRYTYLLDDELHHSSTMFYDFDFALDHALDHISKLEVESAVETFEG